MLCAVLLSMLGHAVGKAPMLLQAAPIYLSRRHFQPRKQIWHLPHIGELLDNLWSHFDALILVLGDQVL